MKLIINTNKIQPNGKKQLNLNGIKRLNYEDKVLVFIDNKNFGIPFSVDEVESFYLREDYKPRKERLKLITTDYLMDLSHKVYGNNVSVVFKNGKYSVYGIGVDDNKPMTKEEFMYSIIERMTELLERKE